ncbi:BZ3500_MvSof-1268-A1-R1_Chr10-1g02705 [Microbotryum saponariae]|uniref:BZ3500_MvSof-1268-A1-R1_Chr10-1g02705 protein n=1 Tax=Microbotryum saponariae TaxID=289078 RepID=A0A2X0LGN5_9BASI|nr:BZ3500_MvSof-1268-A1-R1_Chr10-1g02705 [Microbotryum saponariae]SDA06194.1 BZ3501_MvSof-1269-A2-R1_Chr10-1g02306 [Microbotryum saponariae]
MNHATTAQKKERNFISDLEEKARQLEAARITSTIMENIQRSRALLADSTAPPIRITGRMRSRPYDRRPAAPRTAVPTRQVRTHPWHHSGVETLYSTGDDVGPRLQFTHTHERR